MVRVMACLLQGMVGDLNGDGKPDVVQVLKQTNPRNVLPNDAMGPNPFDTNPRILAVAFAAAAGGFDLTLENHTLIPRPEYPTMDDPLDPEGVQPGGIEVKNGVLRVTLGLPRCGLPESAPPVPHMHPGSGKLRQPNAAIWCRAAKSRSAVPRPM